MTAGSDRGRLNSARRKEFLKSPNVCGSSADKAFGGIYDGMERWCHGCGGVRDGR